MPINTKQYIDLTDLFLKKISSLDIEDQGKINAFAAHSMLCMREENKRLLVVNKELNRKIKLLKLQREKPEMPNDSLCFDFLNENENLVMNLRAQGKSLRECGLVLSLSGNRISQIEFVAFKKIIRKGKRKDCELKYPEYFNKRLNEFVERYPWIASISQEVNDKSHIDSLNLTARSLTCLKAESIYLIEDILKLSTNDLLKVPNLGKKSLNEIVKALEAAGHKPTF